MGEHNGGRAALVVINFLVFAGTVALNQLSAFPQYAGGLFVVPEAHTTKYGLGVSTEGIFNTTVGNLSATYEIDVTPAGFVFLIWTVIYFWLLLAHLYALILLCRRNAVGPVYTTPPPVLWFICLTNWIAFGLVHGSLYRHGPWMAQHAKVDLWMYRILWHNGLALYTVWTTIAALLNLGIALRYEARLEMQLIVYIVLGCLSGILVLYFILENTVLDRFVRYTITIYPVVVLAMAGIYIKQYQHSTLETGYFIIVLLGTSVFCLVARLGLVIVRAVKSPLYVNNKVGDDPVLSYAA
ncbi:hypothetical protein Pmani_012104 [Petrolisthes manimaculis]|uniref:Uncharacterized protein n=1 Tax=Petrolisthes manimaculis TaxID=1843537 RepID=A0AAE1Q171_9EUCA|nr:hypothetical protein Pmani_012104 [Petrolisthes manimaculis]